MRRAHDEPEYRRRIREKAEKDQQTTNNERDAAAKRSYQYEIVRALYTVIQEYHRRNAEERAKRQGDRFWEIAGVAGLWLAAFVGVAAIIVGNGDSARQRDVMQRQFNVGERAYVFFYDTHFERGPNNFQQLVKRVQNSGNTSTYHLIGSVQCINVNSNTTVGDPFNLFVWNSNDMMPIIIGPKQQRDLLPRDTTSCDISQDVVNKIYSGSTLRFVAGEVVYYDRINPICRRVTQFAEQIVIRGTVMSAIPRGKHNCADEECPGERPCPTTE